MVGLGVRVRVRARVRVRGWVKVRVRVRPCTRARRPRGAWRRYGGDTGEIHGRCRGDIGGI